MDRVVILSAARTPIGKYGKALADIKATDLGAIAVREAVKRASIDSKDVEECIMGNVISAGLGQNPARQAAVRGGLPVEIGAVTVNAVCGSGMKAAMFAADAIKAKQYDVIVAGGMENMSAAPYLMPGARWGYKMNDQVVKDAMVYDGLWDIFNDMHMGFTGEITAERFKITRAETDRFAYESHMKAASAIRNGKFAKEIVPVTIKQKKGDLIVDTDEGVREDTTEEALAKLRPVFKNDGIVTAGNSSQLSDGASALVISSESFAKERGIRPMAVIEAYGERGVIPEHIMEAPIPTTEYVLKKAGMKMDDIDLFEHNEAFASASLAVMKALNVPREIFNVNGGATALGHPIGCSGARVMTTLVHAMIDRQKDVGLGTLCLGGGNAVTMILRRY
ncbi:MAG: acetyl-CoA C-acetyltransferase [Methanomassiliicoccaceae archaeon]|jgi:acetyl-CoA C-acetyltransferase|nr:acetyl-CoA C-acetyltransferase [Methanomassiliicoccaceae archaeon]